MPYAVAFGEAKEIAFLQTFFDRHVSEWMDDERSLFEPAARLIEKHKMHLLDALHLVAAMEYGAEFVTAEKASKPFHQAYARCLWIADV